MKEHESWYFLIFNSLLLPYETFSVVICSDFKHSGKETALRNPFACELISAI